MDIYAPAANGRGLSKRNLKRLQQFQVPRTFGELLALPDIMMAEMEQGRRRRGAPVLHDARVARMAVAIDLLNTLPIRRRSLITLDLPNNFTELPEGGAKLIVYFDQEKSKKTLGATLSARTWRLISIYSQHYRPLLRGADRSTLLFPGPTRDGHVSPNAFAAFNKRLRPSTAGGGDQYSPVATRHGFEADREDGAARRCAAAVGPCDREFQHDGLCTARDALGFHEASRPDR